MIFFTVIVFQLRAALSQGFQTTVTAVQLFSWFIKRWTPLAWHDPKNWSVSLIGNLICHWRTPLKTVFKKNPVLWRLGCNNKTVNSLVCCVKAPPWLLEDNSGSFDESHGWIPLLNLPHREGSSCLWFLKYSKDFPSCMHLNYSRLPTTIFPSGPSCTVVLQVLQRGEL